MNINELIKDLQAYAFFKTWNDKREGMGGRILGATICIL